MLLRQLRDGPLRGREPVRAGRARATATRARSPRSSETMELRDDVRVARPRLDRAERAAAAARVRRLGRRGALRAAGRADRRPEGLPVRRGADRRDQAVGVQGVRDRLHAGAADRHLHGLERGRLRRLLQLRAARRGGASASRRDGAAQGEASRRDRHARPRRRRQGDAARSSRGSSSRSSATRCSTRSATPRCSSSDGARLAFTTDSYVVKPLFFPGGDIGELAVNGTVNDLAVAGARPRCLSGGLRDRGGLPGRRPAPRSRASMGARGAAAGVPIATGDTKVVERGKADGALRARRPASASLPAGVELGPAAGASRATACSSPARSATTAWR